MMALTRWKNEELVLDLYSQGKTIKGIAKMVHMSFIDVRTVVHKQREKAKVEEVQAQEHIYHKPTDFLER